MTLSSNGIAMLSTVRACWMQGVSLQYICRICMVLSFFCAACAVGLMWGLYPKEYDLGHVRASVTPDAKTSSSVHALCPLQLE